MVHVDAPGGSLVQVRSGVFWSKDMLAALLPHKGGM